MGNGDNEAGKRNRVKSKAGPPQRLDLRIGGMASAFAAGRGNGIFAKASPGLASGNAFEPKPASFEGSVNLNSFDEILRTSGNIAAAGTRPAQFVKHWGKNNLVKTNQFDQKPFHDWGSDGEAICSTATGGAGGAGGSNFNFRTR